ncbi:MAG: hypothetical protein ACOX2G_07315 [Bacillota bacterium]|jgi:hypothetical protein
MRGRLVILLVLGLLIAGCSPASRAKTWAEKAAAETWVARYRIDFHQQDGDLSMEVWEARAEALVLDITMPSGTLRLEYGPDNLLLNLDQGELEWEDFPRQPPYYCLAELSRQILAAGELANFQDWAEFQGYSLKIEGGKPLEVKYLSEWTLYVEEFYWNNHPLGTVPSG